MKGADDSLSSLSAALFGKTRRALLALFYGHPERSFYLREIARAVGAGQGAVQRELAQLTAAGLLVRLRRGNQVFYHANPQTPIFSELKSLIVKTAGVADVLREALAELADDISVAFVHGSTARGQANASSDVDLVIVGDLDFGDVVTALRPAQDRLQREVNPTVYTPAEFRKKLRTGHHFLTAILRAQRIFLVGGERELAGLGAKRLAH
jgi:predicted nucleotidyltransferase